MPDSHADPRDPAQEARNLDLALLYFERVSAGDPNVASLFAEDAVWVTPQSSPMASDSGRRHEGKEAVLRLMSGGVGLYDAESPMQIEREAIAATGDHVFVEMTMNARTGQGQPYTNHYVFVFRMRDGLIVEVHEHLDTLYAQRKLFDPIGQRSPMDATAEGS